MKKIYFLPCFITLLCLLGSSAISQDIGIFAPERLDGNLFLHYESIAGDVDRTIVLSEEFFQEKQLIYYILGNSTMNEPAYVALIQEHLNNGGTLVVVVDHANVYSAQINNANTLLAALGAQGSFELEALERGCSSLPRTEQSFPVSSPYTNDVNLFRYGFIAGFTPGASTTVLINSRNNNPIAAVESLGCGRLIYLTDTNLWRQCLTTDNDNYQFFTNIYNESQDDTPPVLAGVPSDTEASCDNVPAPAVVTATDARDGELEVEFSETRISEECANTYVLQRTWTATDCNGNVASSSQLIEVVDDVAPEIIIPEDYTVYASPGSSTAIVTYEDISATDNCGEVELTFDPPAGSELTIGVHTAMVTANDGCGNISQREFDINVLEATEITLMVNGGGYIEAVNSAGPYASDPGSNVNFGFDVSYFEQSDSYSGEFNLIFRRTEEDGTKKIYQASGITVTSLEITDVNLTSAMAIIVGTTDLYEVSEDSDPVLVQSSADIVVGATDNGEPGRHNDRIGFMISEPGGALLYSSSWNGAETEQLALSGGNIQIHGASPESNGMDLTSTMAGDPVSLSPGMEEVQVFPNPSSGIFNLRLTSEISENPVEIMISSLDGKLILSENLTQTLQAEFNLSGLRPGVYLMQIIQGDKRIIRRLQKH